jgi:hypothetical protein
MILNDLTIDDFIPLKLDVDKNLDELKNIYYNPSTQYYTRLYILYYILDQHYSKVQTGGNLYKLDKYSYKLKQNNNDKYRIKYNYYKNILLGGNTNTDFIDKIVDENIDLNINGNNCITEDYEDGDYEDGDYEDDKQMRCIRALLPIPTQREKYEENFKMYQDKRELKSYSTDTFMKILSEKYIYKILLDYILIQLYLCFSKCIYLINIKYDINLTDKHIKLLYKGGNSIRLLIHLYAEYNYDDLTQAEFIKDHIKIGDWDFNVKLDEDINDKTITHLQTLGFENKDIFKNYLLKKIKLSLLFGLVNIKNKIDSISDLSIILGELNDECRIENMICNQKEQKSFIITDELKNFNSIIKKISLIDNFYNPDGTTVIKSKSFIVYIDEINSRTAFITNIFSLFRLKINNIVDNIIAPIELLDVSITDYNDTRKIMFNYLFLIICKDKPKYILNKYELCNIEIILPIPSQYYMFIELYLILLKLDLFPWNNNKYEKRLLRFFKLYLLCQNIITKKDKDKIREILKIFNNKILDLISTLNIEDKYEQLKYIYNKSKQNIFIISDIVEIISDIPIIEKNNYLYYLYGSIYEIIICLIYLEDDTILLVEHKEYCDKKFNFIKECDDNTNPKCNDLDMEYYSFDKVKTNKIEDFIKYLLTIYNIISKIIITFIYSIKHGNINPNQNLIYLH